MNSPYPIRRAQLTDLPVIYDGELDYIRQIEPHQEARWRDAMRFHLAQWIDDLDRMFIAERDAARVGYCFWEIHGDDAVLASIYVLPGERGRGLGRQLLATFVADARSREFRNLKLGVRADNPARHLYEKMGFRHTHDERGYCHYVRLLDD